MISICIFINESVFSRKSAKAGKLRRGAKMRKTIPAGILSFLLIFTFCACSLFEPEPGFWQGGEYNPGTIVCEEAELLSESLQRLDIPEDVVI